MLTRPSLSCCCWLFFSLFCLTIVGQEQKKSASLTLGPCNSKEFEATARCGTYEVYENRTTKTGRKISLKIVVLPATGSDREPDPLVYFAGGPGSSATEDAPYIARDVMKIREHRDLLFVDQRGTGGSNPLNCEFFDSTDLQSYLGYFFPLNDVRQCRKQLEPKADLNLYTTQIAADDMDEVRAALGYDRLNLSGGSYGTRAALVYLRQHPEHVRTIMLFGVAPTNQFMPRAFPRDTERAFRGVLAECSADETCEKAFPNLQAETEAVLTQLLKGPVEVQVHSVSDPGNLIKVRLSRDLAAEAIRYMLYNPAAASRIPLFLHVAAQGDFRLLAEAALSYRRNLVATGSNGMYLSVTCAEDMPGIKPGEGERLAAETFLGDYRLRQQREACALWPYAEIPSDYSKPVISNLPALIITGQWDPVTPPSNGDGVARYLSNSLHVIVPHGGHGLGGLEGVECIDRLQTEFVARGTTTGLDISCVKAIKRKGWAEK